MALQNIADEWTEVPTCDLVRYGLFLMQEIGTWNASIDDESYNTDEVFDTVRARNVTAVHVEGDGVIQIEGEGTAQEYIKRIPGDYYQPPEWVTRDAEVLWLVRFTLADEGYAEGEIEVW